MRILLAAPQDRTVLGVVGKNCRDALVELGNEVEVFDFRAIPFWNRFLGRLRMSIRSILRLLPLPGGAAPDLKSGFNSQINRRFEEAAFRFNPELILVLFGENIIPATLENIRSRQNRPAIVNWFHDTLLESSRRKMLEQVVAGYDIIFMVDTARILDKFSLPAPKVEVLPLACNPRVHRKVQLTREEKDFYGSDVAFVGTVSPERLVWLEQLVEFDLKIWGRWTKESSLLKHCYRKKDVYSDAAVKIYNGSKIIIDFHSLWGRQEQIFNVTPRVFEVPASGGFLLTNDCLQLADFYRVGEEMAVYKSIDDLKILIRYFLGHERERLEMAEKAWIRAHKEHTYSNRLRTLLKTVTGKG